MAAGAGREDEGEQEGGARYGGRDAEVPPRRGREVVKGLGGRVRRREREERGDRQGGEGVGEALGI